MDLCNYFDQKQRIELKTVDLFLTNTQLLASQDGLERITLWIIVMFLSAVWTLILTAPIHCRGSIGEQVMQCYISPNLMKKQTCLHLGWPENILFLGKLFFTQR